MLSTNADTELPGMLLKGGSVLIFVEQGPDRHGFDVRSHHRIGLKVEDTLQLFEGHVENGTDFRWQALQKPDMGHRSGQLDMAQPLAAYLGLNDLDTAFFADHTAVFHPFVLAAVALVVLDRTKDLGAKQTVAFRFERAVVDGFRLF